MATDIEEMISTCLIYTPPQDNATRILFSYAQNGYCTAYVANKKPLPYRGIGRDQRFALINLHTLLCQMAEQEIQNLISDLEQGDFL